MTQSDAPNEPKPPVWYSEKEMNHWLRRLNYSKEIADELSVHWAVYLQGAFDKGFEKGKELRDQLSKERREKEKLKELHIHQETHLNDQFEKERKMRKELVESLVYISKNLGGLKVAQDEPESIAYHEALNAIKKASELDKNQ